jgi:adenylate cyclase
VPLAFPRLSAVASVGLLGASSLLGWIGLAWLASSHDPDFSPVGPLATNLFLLAVAVPYQWQLTQRRSRHLLSTLRQYVAPAWSRSCCAATSKTRCCRASSTSPP